ncbi:unnamed protein product [Brassica rapa subsp. trilocularis]
MISYLHNHKMKCNEVFSNPDYFAPRNSSTTKPSPCCCIYTNCLFIFLSLLTIGKCVVTQLDAGEIESSSKIILPPKCVPYICYGVNCWCCKRDPVGDGQCFKTLEECKSNRKCPWL